MNDCFLLTIKVEELIKKWHVCLNTPRKAKKEIVEENEGIWVSSGQKQSFQREKSSHKKVIRDVVGGGEKKGKDINKKDENRGNTSILPLSFGFHA